MPVLDSIDELKLISTSSSILNDEDVRAFDCGYQELNDVFLDIYNKYDEESGHVLAIVNQNFELLGFISCRLASFSFIAQGKEMGISIDYLGVHKDCQKRGIGSLLVTFALRLSLTIDCWLPIKGVRVHALEDAVEFYEKLGFIDPRGVAIYNGKPVTMYFSIEKLRNGEIMPLTQLFETSLGNDF